MVPRFCVLIFPMTQILLNHFTKYPPTRYPLSLRTHPYYKLVFKLWYVGVEGGAPRLWRHCKIKARQRFNIFCLNLIARLEESFQVS